MRRFKKQIQSTLILVLGFMLFLQFQNCGKVGFTETKDQNADLGVCDGVSCSLDPLTTKPAVTTILLALGDEANSQLVVNRLSAQLLAETVVRYSTPKANPKILVVRDNDIDGEDPEDTTYVVSNLLKRYHATYLVESGSGITDEMLDGYDLVWFNNPGHPMSFSSTRDVLNRFKGGVVLQGDDLTHLKSGQSITDLTGLEYVDNGTAVTCPGGVFQHDNNAGYKVSVRLDKSKMPGATTSTVHFQYGNDIDNSTPARADLEVLATAVGGHSSCVSTRPTIVRYLKD
jgi:hypothetical protein